MSCEFGPECLAVLPDGRILVAGRVFGGQIGVRRYLADGSPDYSFGGGGAWAELPGGNELDTVNKLLVLHGQPLVVGAEQVPGTGYADNQMALTLFQADGGFSSNPPPKPGEGPFPPLLPSSDESSSSSGPGNSGASAGVPHSSAQSGGSLAGASTNTVAAALKNAILSPHDLSRRVSDLVKSGVCSIIFNAPGPGTITVRWMSTSAQASRHRHKARPIIVASGTRTFNAAGRGTVTLHLTAAGRRLLRSSRSLRLATMATFRPIGETAVTKQGVMTIRVARNEAVVKGD